MGRLLQLLRHRQLLGSILDEVVKAAQNGGTLLEIRHRLIDGVQREDVVSDDALERVRRANERARR